MRLAAQQRGVAAPLAKRKNYRHKQDNTAGEPVDDNSPNSTPTIHLRSGQVNVAEKSHPSSSDADLSPSTGAVPAK